MGKRGSGLQGRCWSRKRVMCSSTCAKCYDCSVNDEARVTYCSEPDSLADSHVPCDPRPGPYAMCDDHMQPVTEVQPAQLAWPIKGLHLDAVAESN